MFETKILTGSELPDQLSTLEGGTLRAFDWPELVARIAATSDLRRLVKGSGASFGDFAALADETLENGKHAVNPNALGAGKTLSSKAVVDDEHATLGDRNNA